MQIIQTLFLAVIAIAQGQQLIDQLTTYPSFAQALEACDQWERQDIKHRHCDIDQGLSRSVDGYASIEGSDNRLAIKAFKFR